MADQVVGRSGEKQSGGRITVKRFPGSQMGPVQQHYDFARTGQADVAWFLHGATPGRFPLTELVQLPYLVGSAEIGTKVINDPELRGETSRRRAPGRQGAAAAHRTSRATCTRPRSRSAPPMTCAGCASGSPRRRSAISSPRSAGRRSACCRPSRSSSCRKAPSTECSSTTAAPASRSRWAAFSSTRPRCTPTCRASAWA